MARKFRVKVNGKSYDVEIEELNGAASGAEKATELPPIPPVLPVRPRAILGHAIGNIVSPIPGKVLRVAAEIGKAVTRGDVLMIIESMKIENPIFAPKDGKVQEVRVQQGSQVKIGELLIVLA